MNASWPFAKLSVSAGQLALASLGTYVFSPSQVVSIQPVGSIPLLASGIRINHNRNDYPEKIIFWCVGNRDGVLTEITKSGFLPSGHPVQRAAGFPLKWSVVLVVIVLWNVLFMLDDAGQSESRAHVPGAFAILALLLLFGLATAVRVSQPVQRVILREGHDVGEIKAFLVLLQLVAGLLSIGFMGAWLALA